MLQTALEIIALLFIIPWYFKSAKSMGKNPWIWSTLSLFIFMIPTYLWTIFVIPFFISFVQTESALIANIILVFLALSAIVVGILAAKFFHWGYLEESKKDFDWPEDEK